MSHRDQDSFGRELLDQSETVVGRRRLLGAGGAVGLGLTSLTLPSAAFAATGGAPEAAGFSPSTVGAQFYMFRRSDVQLSVGWARAAGEQAFTYNIAIELISDGDPGTAPTPVPGAVVTVENEPALANGESFGNSRFWTISSLWTGAWGPNNGSVFRATLVSNTSPAVTVVLTRTWPMDPGDTLSIT